MTNLKKALALAKELELATRPLCDIIMKEHDVTKGVTLTQKERGQVHVGIFALAQRALLIQSLLKNEIATEKAVWKAIEKERRRQNAIGGKTND